jgi:SAM-dependent methyltransferase
MTRLDWDERADLGELRAVIDPADIDDLKNRLIDQIHWNRLRGSLRKARDVLDLGCGTGRFARRLTSCGLSYVGVDTSAKMVAAAKRINTANDSAFLVFDGRTIPAESGSFDVCVTVGVYQYLVHGATAEPLLRDIRRVLRSGGRLIMIEQASRSGRSSGSVERGATERDYISLVSPCFQVRSVSRVRSCNFSPPTRALLRMGKRGLLASPLIRNAVATFEACWVSCRSERYFERVDYFDVLIEAVAA